MTALDAGNQRRALKAFRAVDRRTATLAYRYVTRILPLAVSELQSIRARAQAISEPSYRHQAIASAQTKDFHVYGGCILATFLDDAAVTDYVRIVAVYESAVDYLDNLCDRIGNHEEADFRALHEALEDAITPGRPLRPYFRYRARDDGGYLNELVTQSQTGFAALPAYTAVADGIADVTRRYCELQSRKHLATGERERRCAEYFASVAPDLTWWEGAAASGSTMPTFALAFAALDPSCSSEYARALHAAYFPYFSALHILLDYFVDQIEDRDHHELNFVACYAAPEAARTGIVRILEEALRRVHGLPDADRHLFALRAMCAFYCSRPSVRRHGYGPTAAAIMRAAGLDGGGYGKGDRLIAPLLASYARATEL